MSQGNTVIWNQLERIGSGDLNLGETMSATTALMVAYALLFQRGEPNNRTNGLGPRVGNCVAGMNIASAFPTLSAVRIAEGVLFDWSTTVPAVPPADNGFQSNFRMATSHPVLTGTNSTLVNLTKPTSAPVYFVVCGRVLDQTVSDTRDIKDAGTGAFVPTNVPVQNLVTVDYTVVYSAEGATDFPDPIAALSAEWVPIGGGTLDTAGVVGNVWDFRISPSAYLAQQGSGLYVRGGRVDNVLVGGNLSFDTVVAPRLMGMDLNFTTYGGVDPAVYLEPGTTLTGSTNYYIYITAPNFPIAPHGGAGGTLANNAMVVISHVTPTTGYAPYGLNNVWQPSAVITPLAPYTNFFSGGKVQPNQAILIGAIRRNFGNTGWVEQTQINGKCTVQRWQWQNNTISISPTPFSVDLGLPYMARKMRFSISVDLISTGAGGFVLFELLRDSEWGPRNLIYMRDIFDSFTTYVPPSTAPGSSNGGEYFFDHVAVDGVLGLAMNYTQVGMFGGTVPGVSGFWIWSVDSYEW